MSIPERQLRERIADQGPIPFAEFMEEALYGEGGYYTQASLPIGVEGDFVTGSSLSPLFGRATATLLQRMDAALDRQSDYLEVGYGSGSHLSGVIEGLGGIGSRRVVAVDRVIRPVPVGVETDTDLARIEPSGVNGLVFSYELFDAMPVHRLIRRQDGSLGELWVALDEERAFRFEEGELSKRDLQSVLGEDADLLQAGQIADVAPAWQILYGQLAERLGTGLLVTCDYGFEREKLLDPRVRMHGTLACYKQQRVHRNALTAVGEQDLTAHVDFTTLREAGEAAGLQTVALTRQARWLLACGIFDQLEDAEPEVRLQALDLLNAEGMGEEIRVLVQARGVEPESVFDLEMLSS